MSRTRRAKHFEREHPNGAFVSEKIAGYYTQHNWVLNEDTGYLEWIEHAPTKEQYWNDWKFNHADGRGGQRGPNKKFRKAINAQEDTKYKRQFNRWLHNPEFEIVDQTLMSSARWAWF